MKKQYLEDVQPGDNFNSILLIKSCRLLPTRAGKLYLDIEMVDRTGRIKGKMWDAAREDAEVLAPGTFVVVRGFVDKYREELQLKVEAYVVVEEDTVDLAEFMPTSRFAVEEMAEFLRSLGESLENEHLRELWGAVLSDEEFMKLFSACPAAVSYHHVFLGGLFEHTCEVVRLADAVAAIRPELNRGLLLSGALLHDAGKVAEYSSGPAFEFQSRGLLLGHIYIGAEMISKWTSEIEGFPPKLADELKHLVLSHHGTKEFGSPVEPSFAESIVLHYVDNIDAKLNNIKTTIANDPAASEELFTRQQSPMLRRRIYRHTLIDEDEGYNPFVVEESEKDDVKKQKKSEEGPTLFPHPPHREA